MKLIFVSLSEASLILFAVIEYSMQLLLTSGNKYTFIIYYFIKISALQPNPSPVCAGWQRCGWTSTPPSTSS